MVARESHGEKKAAAEAVQKEDRAVEEDEVHMGPEADSHHESPEKDSSGWPRKEQSARPGAMASVKAFAELALEYTVKVLTTLGSTDVQGRPHIKNLG